MECWSTHPSPPNGCRAPQHISLVWITKAFNLEWLLNLWERGKPQNKPSKKGLWRNWKMLTLKLREEVGKNTSKCRHWFTKVDAYWKIVTFQKVKTHTHCTQISWTSWKRRDNWSLNTSVRLLKLVCTTDWSAGQYNNLLHWYWNWAWINCCYCWIVVPPSPHILCRPRSGRWGTCR